LQTRQLKLIDRGAIAAPRMVTITFSDRESEKRALAFLLGRFSGRVLRTGEHLVPEAALAALAEQNILFAVKSIDGQLPHRS
jgi:hypothetical protein